MAETVKRPLTGDFRSVTIRYSTDPGEPPFECSVECWDPERKDGRATGYGDSLTQALSEAMDLCTHGNGREIFTEVLLTLIGVPRPL
jgi:hypothetical protein